MSNSDKPMQQEPEGDHSVAAFPPTVVRAALSLVRERGYSPDRMCKGLGFAPADLRNIDFRLSYRQVSQLLKRISDLLKDTSLGISAGARENVVSWGFTGLGMLTCETFRDAIEFAVEHQASAGAVLTQRLVEFEQEVCIEATPKFFDSDIEAILVDEAFASAIAIGRQLIGESFSPIRVEFTHREPKDTLAHRAYFRCPIYFGMAANRLVAESSCLATRLPGHDEYTSNSIREKLRGLTQQPVEQSDLLETLSAHVRSHLDEHQALSKTAAQFNISERTLRRRLTELGVSYREMLDRVRYERSLDLLKRRSMTINEIAMATGFVDGRSFRRAFKRWSGVLPSEINSKSSGNA